MRGRGRASDFALASPLFRLRVESATFDMEGLVSIPWSEWWDVVRRESNVIQCCVHDGLPLDRRIEITRSIVANFERLRARPLGFWQRVIISHLLTIGHHALREMAAVEKSESDQAGKPNEAKIKPCP